jgi:hypothetical protein
MTIFSHRYKPEFVALMAALLQREDITDQQLDQVEELVAQRKHK